MLDILKQFQPRVADEIDYASPTDVVQTLLSTEAQLRNIKRDEALLWFLRGKLLIMEETGVTVQEFSEVLNSYSSHDLSIAKTVARHFDCDEERFLSAFDTFEGTRSWRSFIKPVLGITRKKLQRGAPSVRKLIEKVTTLVNDMKSDPVEHAKNLESLAAIRDMIDRVAPALHDVRDRNFIKYHSCASCGSYPPPPEGHYVVDRQGVQVPQCKSCFDIEAPVNWHSAATMYSNYARACERG